MINYGRQDINEADIAAVVRVLRSDFLTQGAAVPCFEQAVAEFTGAKYAVAVNSATAALHIACLALDLGVGDWLWTSPTTFVASANCALYCGARVDFVDIDPKTYNMSVEHLAEKLVVAERNGVLPKIVVPVHMGGQSCDMGQIAVLARRYGFRVIEDASHAIGGRYQGQPVGDCRYSEITVFSFHPVKIITTGEGGMCVTNNAELADRMRRYRSHGITSDSARMRPRPDAEIWNYQQIDLGFNYRMTDIQAALGSSQMKRLEVFVDRRQEIAAIYDRVFENLALRTPWQHPATRSSYHLYVVRLLDRDGASQQRRVYEFLHDHGIVVNLHYIPVYRQPYYEDLGFRAGYCPEAERYHREAISLPIYAALTDSQLDEVIQHVRSALSFDDSR
jgi:UDP-4-amino-4,6-dideoxy-N-acetyl-beta-L-altrosamine transaminase